MFTILHSAHEQQLDWLMRRMCLVSSRVMARHNVGNCIVAPLCPDQAGQKRVYFRTIPGEVI